MSATPHFDAIAAELHRIRDEWTATRTGARVALYWHGTWEEKTGTTAKPSRPNPLIPQQRPLPAGATRLTLEGGAA